MSEVRDTVQIIPTRKIRGKGIRRKLRYLEFSMPSATEDILSSPDAVYRFLNPLYNPIQEELYVIALTGHNKPLICHLVAKGSANSVKALPADVLRLVLLSGSIRFLLAHNHPSGDTDPSDDDLAFTSRLNTAADLLGLSLVDHLIFTDKAYFSMRRNGLV